MSWGASENGIIGGCIASYRTSTSFLFLAGQSPVHEIAVFSGISQRVHWAVQVHFHPFLYLLSTPGITLCVLPSSFSCFSFRSISLITSILSFTSVFFSGNIYE